MNDKHRQCKLDDNVNDSYECQTELAPNLCSSTNLTTTCSDISGRTIADEILSTIATNNNKHSAKQSMPFECTPYLVSDW